MQYYTIQCNTMQYHTTEAEKPRKVFARPVCFCACPQNWPKKQVKNICKSGKIQHSLEISGQSGKFPGS